MRDGALPSPANQALVLSGVVEAATRRATGRSILSRPSTSLGSGCWKAPSAAIGACSTIGARELKFRWGEPVSNHPEWRIEAALGIGAALLVFATAWLSRGARRMLSKDDWRRDLAIAAIALSAGLVFGWAVLGLPMEPPEPGDRLRSAGMIALSLLVPMVAAGAVARSAPLGSLAVALNPPLRRQADAWSLLLAILFAATFVAAIHVALGLVFDPRYKDFQLALLSGPVVALAIVDLGEGASALRREPGMAEWVAAGVLTGSALFVMFNEGIANWQALWFGALLVCARAYRATGPRPREAEHEQRHGQRRETRVVEHEPERR